MASVALAKIKSLLRLARTGGPASEEGEFPTQQVQYMGKTGDAVPWFPYGFHARTPADELVILLSLQGNPEARVSLPGSPSKRIKTLQAGELAVYHPPSGSRIHFKEDGSIEITSTQDLVASVSGDLVATVEGDATIDASGDARIESGGTATIEAGTIELGDGATDKLLNETALATFNAHVHSGNNSGAPNTGTPTTSMVVDTDTTTKARGD